MFSYQVVVPLLLLYNQVFLSLCLSMHIKPFHSFADDLHLYIYISTSLNKISKLLHSMKSCMSDIKGSETANMFKLNDNKGELMHFM